MRHWRLIGLGLGVYALGLIATAPATLIDAPLQRATEGRLRLAEASGTLWSGAGLIEIRNPKSGVGIARSVAWRMRPAYVLSGRLRYEVALGQSPRRFPVTILLSRIDVAEADIVLPAMALGLADPRLAPLELTGELLLRVSRLAIGRSALQGNATLQWRAAGSSFSPVSPLGDYEMRLEGEGTAVRTWLRTLEGPVHIEGEGSWTAGRNPEFQGTARVPPQHQQQLVPLLRLIAVDRGDGSFALQLR